MRPKVVAVVRRNGRKRKVRKNGRKRKEKLIKAKTRTASGLVTGAGSVVLAGRDPGDGTTARTGTGVGAGTGEVGAGTEEVGVETGTGGARVETGRVGTGTGGVGVGTGEAEAGIGQSGEAEVSIMTGTEIGTVTTAGAAVVAGTGTVGKENATKILLRNVEAMTGATARTALTTAKAKSPVAAVLQSDAACRSLDPAVGLRRPHPPAAVAPTPLPTPPTPTAAAKAAAGTATAPAATETTRAPVKAVRSPVANTSLDPDPGGNLFYSFCLFLGFTSVLFDIIM